MVEPELGSSLVSIEALDQFQAVPRSVFTLEASGHLHPHWFVIWKLGLYERVREVDRRSYPFLDDRDEEKGPDY